MKNTGKKKGAIINFRVNQKEKDRIIENAHSLGMSVGEYLIHLDKYKTVVVLDEGKEFAHEIYQLNKKLNKLEKYPLVELSELRNVVSESIMHLNRKMKGYDPCRY